MLRKISLALGFCLLASTSFSQQVTVNMRLTKKPNASIGTITFEDTPQGLLILPKLKGLLPGLHGLHVHVNPSCANGGKDAGGHLDPQHTNMHLGPYSPLGHLGDMPALYVNQNGVANHQALAPRLSVAQLYGHSIMLHAGGDNYADHPALLGGGGARLACAVVKK